MNSLAPEDSGGDSSRVRNDVGTGPDICTIIATILRHLATKDDPVIGEEEELGAGEIGSGLRVLLSNLREGWLQLLEEMAESSQPMEAVRPFTEHLSIAVRELGSYINAKRQLPSEQAGAREYKPRTAAIDDLHDRNARLVKVFAALNEQCKQGVLAEIMEDDPDNQERSQGY